MRRLSSACRLRFVLRHRDFGNDAAVFDCAAVRNPAVCSVHDHRQSVCEPDLASVPRLRSHSHSHRHSRAIRLISPSLGTIGMTINDPDFKTPYSHQYNLNIQWEFMKNYMLEVGYVGTAGINLLTRREINPSLDPARAASTTQVILTRVACSTRAIRTMAEFGGAVFSGITNQETSANSNYNSLQVTVSKRFSDGFYFQNAYTWSHCIDNSSGLRSNTRCNDPRADRGNCDQDIRHRNVLSYIYELPFYKDQRGFAGKILGGWQMSVV